MTDPSKRRKTAGTRARTLVQREAAPNEAELRSAFCTALAETANVTRSCKIAELGRTTAYLWRNSDTDFAKAWDAALERGTDALEDEAVRRGHEGTEKPVYQGGKLVGTVREYSDTMLTIMLKARRPDKFKDRATIEHDVVGNLAERLGNLRKRRSLNIGNFTKTD
jgi:DsbC/DsbD-like thiol-disulfide interchange protein